MNGSVKNKKTTKNVLQISGFWSFILVTDMMQKTQQKKDKNQVQNFLNWTLAKQQIT